MNKSLVVHYVTGSECKIDLFEGAKPYKTNLFPILELYEETQKNNFIE